MPAWVNCANLFVTIKSNGRKSNKGQGFKMPGFGRPGNSRSSCGRQGERSAAPQNDYATSHDDDDCYIEKTKSGPSGGLRRGYVFLPTSSIPCSAAVRWKAGLPSRSEPSLDANAEPGPLESGRLETLGFEPSGRRQFHLKTLFRERGLVAVLLAGIALAP
jgi:hypothetical protein